MKNKYLLKVVAGVMLSVSLATIPTVYFTEPALAASKKKNTKKAKVKSTYEQAMDEATREFVRREKIPNSVVRAGEISILRSYTSQFKAIQGEGAAIFSEPNTRSKRIVNLYNGAKLLAEAEFVGSSGDWYYVHFQNRYKGWVHSKFITERDPDENE